MLESISEISILDMYGITLKSAFLAADLVDTESDFTDQTFLNVMPAFYLERHWFAE